MLLENKQIARFKELAGLLKEGSASSVVPLEEKLENITSANLDYKKISKFDLYKIVGGNKKDSYEELKKKAFNKISRIERKHANHPMKSKLIKDINLALRFLKDEKQREVYDSMRKDVPSPEVEVPSPEVEVPSPEVEVSDEYIVGSEDDVPSKKPPPPPKAEEEPTSVPPLSNAEEEPSQEPETGSDNVEDVKNKLKDIYDDIPPQEKLKLLKIRKKQLRSSKKEEYEDAIKFRNKYYDLASEIYDMLNKTDEQGEEAA